VPASRETTIRVISEGPALRFLMYSPPPWRETALANPSRAQSERNEKISTKFDFPAAFGPMITLNRPKVTAASPKLLKFRTYIPAIFIRHPRSIIGVKE